MGVAVTKSGAYMAGHREEFGKTSTGRAKALLRSTTLPPPKDKVKKPGLLEELKHTAKKTLRHEENTSKNVALARPAKLPAAAVAPGIDFLAELKSKTSRRAKE